MLLWYFLKRLIQVHVNVSREIKIFQAVSRVASYCYLGIEFANNDSWNIHVQKVINSGKKKLNQLLKFLSNRNTVEPLYCGPPPSHNSCI